METFKILKMCGWYYLEDGYLTNPKLVSDPILEDYRKYKLTLEEAISFEVNFLNRMAGH